MKEHERTHETAKNVAKQNFANGGQNEGGEGGAVLTGIRKWEKKVFKPAWTKGGKRFFATQFAVRVAHDRERKTVNLETPDRREAARKALTFVGALRVGGWDRAFETLGGGEPARLIAERAAPTVGEYIAAAKRVAVNVSPRTFADYEAKFRWICACVAGVAEGGLGTKERRDQVDRLRLSILEPRGVEAALIAYIRRRGGTPEARRTAFSGLKQAKSLFGKKILRQLPEGLAKNVFAEVRLESPRAPRYVATFNHAALVDAARTELREGDPQSWLAFLLLLCGGLRRGELDGLCWSDVDTAKGVLRVRGTKTAESSGEVPIAPDVARELERLRATASGPYVLEGHSRKLPANRRKYRCEETFVRLAKWLRAHGVASRTPLHTLRKESGSVVNAEHGIHLAAAHLRHSSIRITSAHYADHRARAVVPFSLPPVAGGGK